MSRVGIALVLLLAMLWQSVAIARAGSAVNPVADLAHAVLHSQVDSHHHHEDGSYHLDDSAESAQHLIADHVSVAIGLLPTVATSVPLTGTTPRAEGGQSPGPHPFLDGPLKPPRLSA